MRYIVREKDKIETIAGDRYRVHLEPTNDFLLARQNVSLWVEQLDFDALSVGQEITVDVVPVPKEGV